jgi:hypothetical protein
MQPEFSQIKIVIGGMAEHAGEVSAGILQKSRSRQFVTAGSSANLLKSLKNTCFKSGVLQIVGNNGGVMSSSDDDGVKAHVGHNRCSFHR